MAQLRAADTRDALPQAQWTGPDGPGSWLANHQPVHDAAFAGKWIQYRLALGAVNGVSSPRIAEVSVEYELPRAR